MNIEKFVLVRHTDNFEAMRHFYADQLGFTPIQSWDRPGNRGTVLSAGGNAAVELLSMHDLTVPGATPANTALSLEVDNADAWLAALQARGVRIARGLEDMPWGHRSFGVDDPDGLRLWFYHVIRDTNA